MIFGPRPVEKYLEELATCLSATPAARDILDEARDHLLESAAAYRATGASAEASEGCAVQEFGAIEQLVGDFRAVIVLRDAQRQARWQLGVVGLLGACGFTVFRLIPLWRGQLSDVVPPPVAACVAAIVLLWPSLVLMALSLNSRAWQEPRWTATLANVRSVVSWLFAFGLPLCASMVTDQVAVLVGASHAWLLAGALGGYLVSRRVVPSLASAR